MQALHSGSVFVVSSVLPQSTHCGTSGRPVTLQDLSLEASTRPAVSGVQYISSDSSRVSTASSLSSTRL